MAPSVSQDTTAKSNRPIVPKKLLTQRVNGILTSLTLRVNNIKGRIAGRFGDMLRDGPVCDQREVLPAAMLIA